jgi:hypothetical protein
MEVAILGGLVGLGYLFNEKNQNNNPVNSNVNIQPNVPNGDNIYNSEHYNHVDEKIRLMAKENFEESQQKLEDGKHPQVVNFQKLNYYGSGRSTEDENDTLLEELKEGMGNHIYSSASGTMMSNDHFMKNDQGISMAPYFKGNAPTNEGLENSRTLSMHQGGNLSEFHQSKREQPAFFPLEKQEVFGNTFGEGIGDPNRYDTGILKTNQLPFTQERVAHIDVKDPINQSINQLIANSTNIDKLRSESNPKLTYKGKVLPGKNINESRGINGEVFKHKVDPTYENDADKWLVTNGAFLEKTQRPLHVVPETNRSVINHQPIGSAAPVNHEGLEKRPGVRKPMRNQLGTDTMRNFGGDVNVSGIDVQKGGYRALPNERDVTHLRNHQSNLQAGYNAQTLGIQDSIKKTVKQTTIDSKNNGNMDNVTLNTVMRLQDDVKKTKKQTTIDSQNNGYITGGYEKNTLGYEAPENTMKDTTMFDYMGGAGGFYKGDMDKLNYQNAETNPTKEIIAQGRSPTLNNVKLANGMDTVNMEINKIDSDYMNHYANAVDKVYQNIPEENNGDLTKMKDRLDDEKLAIRIDPSLLNPFRNNPYTKSLESFAY